MDPGRDGNGTGRRRMAGALAAVISVLALAACGSAPTAASGRGPASAPSTGVAKGRSSTTTTRADVAAAGSGIRAGGTTGGSTATTGGRTTTTSAARPAVPPAPPAATPSAAPGSFHGVYEYAGNNSSADAGDPDLAGVVLDYYWSQIEPSKDVYDWTLVTGAMAPWVAAGKQVILRIATAGQASWDPPSSASGTPAWVLADGAPSITDSGETVPVYWSAPYLSDLATFVAAFAARFDGDPDVALVEAGVGMGGETMPETNLSGQGLAAWDAAGYSDATWLATVETISALYRRDFTRTPVYALLTSSFFDGNWADYQALAAWYTSASPAWPLQNDALGATLSLPDRSAWDRASGLALEQAQPTRRSGDTLAADAAAAIDDHVGYLLIYKTDIDDPAWAATLSALATSAGTR